MEGRLPLLSAASSVLVSFVLEAYINSPSREGFYNFAELFLCIILSFSLVHSSSSSKYLYPSDLL
ncbi:unnamed protein product [Brassica rapa]|uniref:Uncharacterized protein n=1 Tax=Brassica campestris TaxID=3711 RepID=A0A8D9H8R4_BRACM|nr:unnamed protein product [Brassica rapa]